MSTPLFPSPYEITPPAGAEDWRSMYPYYLPFSESRKAEENEKFWFCDTLHWPTAFRPMEVTPVEMAIKCLGQMNTRHYRLPPANGIDFRLVNGYVYMNPVGVAPENIPARAEQFMQRAGYYFQNWPTLLENWRKKVASLLEEMEGLPFNSLPESVNIERITDGSGLGPNDDLFKSYHRLFDLAFEGWQYHFEFLNLGYIGFLDFFGFCKETFPNIPDLAISKMVQGMQAELYQPDEELRTLSKLAVELDVDDALLGGGSPDEILARVGKQANGAQWIAAWEAAQDPWFNVSDGSGMYASDRAWRDHLDMPLGYIANYLDQLRAGESIDRPMAALHAERDRITEEYADALDSDEAREAFHGKLGLARLVFPYTEGHTFYIDHWMNGVFYRKLRQLGDLFVDAGFFEDREDIMMFHRSEVGDLIFDLSMGWSVGAPYNGRPHIQAEVKRRKAMFEALKSVAPEPAFNNPPEVITEPFTIMLYGITSENIGQWAGQDGDGSTLKGMAVSSGLVEGVARVIRSAEQLDEVQAGEILVAPITSPTWGPVFNKIKGTVTDIGGMMSHAAIVCREYGLPAVTSTGTGSTRIKTGQRIRVDGSKGTVTLLD